MSKDLHGDARVYVERGEQRSARVPGVVPSVLLIGKLYEDRPAYATAVKLWSEVEFVSASTPMTLNEYADSIEDARLVIDMLVGTLQRLLIYPDQGFMISQPVPDDVLEAYERLCREGFTSRLLATDRP